MKMKFTDQEKYQKVYEIFQSIALDYDKMNEIISLKQHQNWKKLLIKYSNIEKTSKVIDLCCGTGDIVFMLSAARAKEVIGMDFSENMLSVAKERGKALDLKNIEFIHGDVSKLPFESMSVDRI
ncbi:MAG: class I SAM-dependent methyltransferase, partial [Fusobacteria bacterium]|nr:class I SAM-dependent methyltransferase [Fusobacteriota bacterium]